MASPPKIRLVTLLRLRAEAQVRHHTCKQSMLGGVDFRRKGILCIRVLDTHRRLRENGTGIDLGHYTMHGAARDFYAVAKSLADAIEPRKTG